METRILGIVGNTLYIQGFYAGDNSHQLFVPEYELQAFIDTKVSVYDNINYIYCQEHGMTYDQYKEYLNKYNKEY